MSSSVASSYLLSVRRTFWSSRHLHVHLRLFPGNLEHHGYLAHAVGYAIKQNSTHCKQADKQINLRKWVISKWRERLWRAILFALLLYTIRRVVPVWCLLCFQVSNSINDIMLWCNSDNLHGWPNTVIPHSILEVIWSGLLKRRVLVVLGTWRFFQRSYGIGKKVRTCSITSEAVGTTFVWGATLLWLSLWCLIYEKIMILNQGVQKL